MELEYRFATADDIEYLIQTRLDEYYGAAEPPVR